MGHYDCIAQGYDELYKEEQLKKLQIVKENLTINKSDKLLDVGCGTGISSDFDCELTGVDPSYGLLKQSNKKTICARAEKLPFDDHSFDIVISITAIHNFDDAEKGLKEMKRVGKNRFVFSVLKKSKKFNEIKKQIEKHFNIKKYIEEEKDALFFCCVEST